MRLLFGYDTHHPQTRPPASNRPQPPGEVANRRAWHRPDRCTRQVLDLYRRPLRVEGQMEGNWVLMDYGEVIVHIFLPEAREFYDLEAFWGHAKAVR